MKAETQSFIMGLLFGLFLMALTVHVFPMIFRGTREAAVKTGKAEYYLDADNELQWRWKP